MVRNAEAQVGEVSKALNSGRHTTTTTGYWFDTDRTAASIDSPDFQECGLRHIDAQQLPLLMPDLRAQVSACFYNSRHRREPGCGVIAAVVRGKICDELARTRW